MKTEERAVPELVKATRTEELNAEDVEIAADWVEEVAPSAPSTGPITKPYMDAAPEEVEHEESLRLVDRSGPRRAKNHLKTAEIDIDRDRRSTLTSPIPAMLAEWMRKESGIPEKRDPAAPENEAGELTRRLGDSDKQGVASDQSAGYTVEVVNDGNAERRKRAAHLIDRARALMEAGSLRAASDAAEEALVEAEHAAPPGIIEVIEPARPMMARIFAGFVGPLSEVPVMARRLDDMDRATLDDRKRAFLAHVDGAYSLDKIFDAARIPTGDALRIAAWLMREGIIRVV